MSVNIHFTSTSTTGFSSGPAWTFFTQPVAPPVPSPPYTGSYLPALINILDLEIDLADLSYQALAWQVDLVLKTTQEKQLKAQEVLSKLENKHRPVVDELYKLQVRHQQLQAELMALRVGQPAPNPEDTARDNLQKNIDAAKASEKSLQDKLKASKKSGTKAKKLFRQLSSLCHPDKTGNDDMLTELFREGKAALSLGDDHTLKDLLSKAKSYLSGNKNKAKLDALKAKKKRAADNLQHAHQVARNFESSFHSVLLNKSKLTLKEDDLDAFFLQTVAASGQELANQCRFYEANLNAHRNFLASRANKPA